MDRAVVGHDADLRAHAAREQLVLQDVLDRLHLCSCVLQGEKEGIKPRWSNGIKSMGGHTPAMRLGARAGDTPENTLGSWVLGLGTAAPYRPSEPTAL